MLKNAARHTNIDDWHFGLTMRLITVILLFLLSFGVISTPLHCAETPSESVAKVQPAANQSGDQETKPSGEEPANQEQIKKIEKEIQDVIKVSSMLKTKMQDDRAKIQEIMERTKIHEQIMHNLSRDQVLTPPLTPTIKVEDLLRNEKIRLIAEESRRSHDQLQLIKQRQVTQTVTHNPIKVKSF